jgi:hypothetical protein
MIRKVSKMTSILFILLSASVFVQAGKQPLHEGVIFPGEGVDNIRIGESSTKEWPCGKKDDIEVKCVGDRVSEITIRSRYFYIIRSRVKVGDRIDDVFRFYGEGEMEVGIKALDKIKIRYPSQGIGFEINKSDKQITGIIIYWPSLPKSLK